MFLMAFGEIAVSRIQIAKQCHDIFLQVLIFTVWDSFANKNKQIVHCENKCVYGS